MLTVHFREKKHNPYLNSSSPDVVVLTCVNKSELSNTPVCTRPVEISALRKKIESDNSRLIRSKSP